MTKEEFNIEEIAGLGVTPEESQPTIVVDDDENPVTDTDDASPETNSDDPTEGFLEKQDQNTIEVDEDELEGYEGTDGSSDKKPEDTSDGTNQEPEESLYKTFAKDLTEKQVLNFDDETLNSIENEEDLKQAVEDQKNQAVNDILTDLDSKAYGAISHFMNGGTIDSFIEQGGSNAGYKSYGEDALKEDESVQKDILKRYYKETTNFSDQKIDRMIDNLVELESEAIEADKELEKIDQDKQEKIKEQNKKQQEEAKKQQQEFAKNVEKKIQDMDEFIPGQALRKDAKEKMLRNADQVVQKVNKNWEDYLPKLLALDYYGVLDGDFSKVMKNAETKANSKFEEALKRSGSKNASTSTTRKSGSDLEALKAATQYDKQKTARNKRK